MHEAVTKMHSKLELGDVVMRGIQEIEDVSLVLNVSRQAPS